MAAARRVPRLLGVAGPVLALWAVASLLYPYGRDQGTFAWVADVILQGGVPYRDAWEVKGPLTYYAWALVRGLLGPAPWGMRLVELGVVAAALAALAVLGRRLGGARARLWAPVLGGLWLAGGTFWDTAQPDGWCAVLVAVWLAWLGGRPPGRRQVPASALVGGVVLGLKPPLVLLGLLYPLHLLWVERLGAVALARRVGAAALGMLALAGAMLAALHQLGALAPAAEIYRSFLLGDYASRYPGGPVVALGELGRFLFLGKHFPLVGLAALPGLAALGRRDPGAARLLAAWLALTLGLVVLQGRYFSYHFTLAYPPLALAAALGLERGLGQGRAGARALAGLLLLAGVALPLVEGLRAVRYLTGGMDRDRYLAVFHNPPHYDYPAYEAAAALVAAGSEPDDPVLLLGVDGVVNALAGRPAVGRWGVAYRLYATRDPALRARYQEEFMAAFRARPPAYVLLPEGDAMPPLQQRPSASYLDEIPGLAAALAAEYHQVAHPGTVRVMARRAPGRFGIVGPGEGDP